MSVIDLKAEATLLRQCLRNLDEEMIKLSAAHKKLQATISRVSADLEAVEAQVRRAPKA